AAGDDPTCRDRPAGGGAGGAPGPVRQRRGLHVPGGGRGAGGGSEAAGGTLPGEPAGERGAGGAEGPEPAPVRRPAGPLDGSEPGAPVGRAARVRRPVPP